MVSLGQCSICINVSGSPVWPEAQMLTTHNVSLANLVGSRQGVEVVGQGVAQACLRIPASKVFSWESKPVAPHVILPCPGSPWKFLWWRLLTSSNIWQSLVDGIVFLSRRSLSRLKISFLFCFWLELYSLWPTYLVQKLKGLNIGSIYILLTKNGKTDCKCSLFQRHFSNYRVLG